MKFKKYINSIIIFVNYYKFFPCISPFSLYNPRGLELSEI